MVLEVYVDLRQPPLMAMIVDEGILGLNHVGTPDINIVTSTGVRMILIVILGGLCGILSGVCTNLCSQNFGNDIRKSAFRRIMHFSFSQTDDFSVGSLITRTTSDVTQVQNEEFAAAAKSSHCDKIAAKLPNGYDTMLSQTSVSLSQGEQQLIVIGRAFLSYPRILILDEATSSVDTRTELSIQNAMNELMKDRTSLIIAHRLSTIQDADQIIVLDQGRIAENGTHQELLRQGGKYYDLYMTQFAGQAI